MWHARHHGALVEIYVLVSRVRYQLHPTYELTYPLTLAKVIWIIIAKLYPCRAPTIQKWQLCPHGQLSHWHGLHN